jgi:hypothetical protein
MERKKIFWFFFIGISTITDFVLPLMWGLIATIPITFLCWWMVYRTDWFD